MYRVVADINDVKVKETPLDPAFQLQPEMLKQATDEVKMLFLCSPNNPTGNLLRRKDIEHLLENFGGIVVIDEAYADFGEEPSLTIELSNLPEPCGNPNTE